MRIVTSGINFFDIDAYGSTVAYAELLNLRGEPAKAAAASKPNASIPPAVWAWGAPFTRNYQSTADDSFTILDCSDPERLDACVDLSRVTEVIDHHMGNEPYWQKRLGEKVDIEFVGAASTKIYERWAQADLLPKMSVVSARLLMCGILDNTLNFGADVTTDRDRQAYNKLATIADLPEDWPAQYFSACQEMIMSELETSIRDDFKMLRFGGLPEKLGVGQLVIWDAEKLLAESLSSITEVMNILASPWFMSITSISENKTRLFCSDPEIQAFLAQLLNITFDKDIASANRMWLRKEIVKASFDKAE